MSQPHNNKNQGLSTHMPITHCPLSIRPCGHACVRDSHSLSFAVAVAPCVCTRTSSARTDSIFLSILHAFYLKNLYGFSGWAGSAARVGRDTAWVSYCGTLIAYVGFGLGTIRMCLNPQIIRRACLAKYEYEYDYGG